MLFKMAPEVQKYAMFNMSYIDKDSLVTVISMVYLEIKLKQQ